MEKSVKSFLGKVSLFQKKKKIAQEMVSLLTLDNVSLEGAGNAAAILGAPGDAV